uniref:Uncharacterized protein n=1 Tax=Romanomermis culicivorax TaxID=13658 RepID=A0A915HR57_ROMCU
LESKYCPVRSGGRLPSKGIFFDCRELFSYAVILEQTEFQSVAKLIQIPDIYHDFFDGFLNYETILGKFGAPSHKSWLYPPTTDWRQIACRNIIKENILTYRSTLDDHNRLVSRCLSAYDGILRKL